MQPFDNIEQLSIDVYIISVRGKIVYKNLRVVQQSKRTCNAVVAGSSPVSVLSYDVAQLVRARTKPTLFIFLEGMVQQTKNQYT